MIGKVTETLQVIVWFVANIKTLVKSIRMVIILK